MYNYNIFVKEQETPICQILQGDRCGAKGQSRTLEGP